MTMQGPEGPAVLFWQKLYCGAMTLLYVAVTAGGIAMMVFRQELADAATSAGEYLFFGSLMAVLGLAFAALFAAAFFLPRRPWVWVYHIVLIAIGMTSACCLPAAVPLLIFWIRSDVKEYFGRAVAG